MTQSANYRTMVNTVRDLADSFVQFERDLGRLRRLIAVRGEDEVVGAVMEACDTPKRREAIETINERLRQLGVPE